MTTQEAEEIVTNVCGDGGVKIYAVCLTLSGVPACLAAFLNEDRPVRELRTIGRTLKKIKPTVRPSLLSKALASVHSLEQSIVLHSFYVYSY